MLHLPDFPLASKQNYNHAALAPHLNSAVCLCPPTTASQNHHHYLSIRVCRGLLVTPWTKPHPFTLTHTPPAIWSSQLASRVWGEVRERGAHPHLRDTSKGPSSGDQTCNLLAVRQTVLTDAPQSLFGKEVLKKHSEHSCATLK